MSPSSVRLHRAKNQYLGRSEKSEPSLGVYNLGIYNEGVYNSPIGTSIGIRNEWTLGFWIKPNASKEFGTILMVGERDQPNEIRIETAPVPVGTVPTQLHVLIRGADGTVIKHYAWGDWFTDDAWTHTFVQWDGVQLSASKDSISKVPNVQLTDDSGNMSDTPARKIFYGTTPGGTIATFSGGVSHLVMWNTVLEPEELITVFSGGLGMDLLTASGSYISEGALPHWWKPGEDLANIGKDFASSGTLLDFTAVRNITTANVVGDVP